MGTSIATPIRDKKTRDQVYEFLKENYRSWPQLINKPDFNYGAAGPMPDGTGWYTDNPDSRNLDYDSGRCRIGFNCKIWINDMERDYTYALCKWMALRFGKKRSFGKEKQSAPYIVYDGYEAWAVMVKGDLPESLKGKFNEVDPLGVRHLTEFDRRRNEFYKKAMREDPAVCRRLIRKELRRLDKLWAEKFGKAPVVFRVKKKALAKRR